MEEESILMKILGNYPLIKILNHLVIFREFDYSLTDIAENSGVAWSTLSEIWPKLEKMKLVKYTRNVGRAKMYKLNTENKIVQNLIKFADSIVRDYTEENILKRKITA